METFNFASFTFPLKLALPRGSLASRLAEFKKREPRVCGPYQIAPEPIRGRGARAFTAGFYLGSDFEPVLRWQYADETDGARIDHTGWFCDDYQDCKMRGIVGRLPKSRGFIAGWTMGESMASVWDLSGIYDNEREAAYGADECARIAAENEQEYQRQQEREREEEESRTDERFIEAAREIYQDEGRIEVRDTAEVSRAGNGGAYVMAWVWVSHDDLTDED